MEKAIKIRVVHLNRNGMTMKPYILSLREFAKVARLSKKPVRETMQHLCSQKWMKVVKVDGKNHLAMTSVRGFMSLMNLKSPAPIEPRLNHLRAKGFI